MQGQLAEFIAHIEKQKASGAPAAARVLIVNTRPQVVQLDALADVFKLTPVEVRWQLLRGVLRSAIDAPPPPSSTLSHQAAARVVALEQMGRITGVLDDRGKQHSCRTHHTPHGQSLASGKFICITPDEMESVKKFICQRGRVSIADLAVESNRCALPTAYRFHMRCRAS